MFKAISKSLIIGISYNLVFAQYDLKLQYGNAAYIAVTSQSANLCHFASYIMYFQKVIVYNIPAVGKEGLLAYCDLMSFELSL